jgi:two-component system, LytTR family, response regulator
MTTAERVRTVVVEDEPEARRMLCDFLAEASWVELVGEAADGREAVAAIDRLQPALIILDVRLPEMSGLDVLEKTRHQPEVVFATAYDQYAVAAFELGALDYLVKPFGRQRFRRMLERVQRRLSADPEGLSSSERARTALRQSPLRRLFARHGDKIVPIPAGQIVRIQAQGDYAEVHSPGGPYLLHVSLSELVGRLDPDRFVQVHRSHIVNLDAMKLLRPHDERRLVVVLTNGEEIVASRAASEVLRKQAR